MFAVEWCFLDLYLLQVLNVFPDSECTFPHIVPINLVEGSVVAMCQKTGSLLDCRVEAVGNVFYSFLLVWLSLHFILSWPRDEQFGLFLPPFCMRKVSHFRRAAFLERIELVGSPLYLILCCFAESVILNLFLI